SRNRRPVGPTRHAGRALSRRGREAPDSLGRAHEEPKTLRTNSQIPPHDRGSGCPASGTLRGRLRWSTASLRISALQDLRSWNAVPDSKEGPALPHFREESGLRGPPCASG